MDTIENYEEVENKEEDEFDMRDLDWLLDIDINDIDMDNYGKITSTFADDNIGNNTDDDGDDVSNDLNDIAAVLKLKFLESLKELCLFLMSRYV